MKTGSRESQILNLESVKFFLSKLGYKILTLKQAWRYVTGKIQKADKVYFFKLASTSTIGLETQNEVSWNNNIGSLLPPNLGFQIPQIYHQGYFEDLFYYIGEYVDGKTILEQSSSTDYQLLEIKLSQIAGFYSWLKI